MRTLLAKPGLPDRLHRTASAAIGIAVAATLLSGCVTIAEHRKLEREVRTFARGGTGTRVADLGAQLAEIERRLGVIEGRLGDLQNDSERALEEARKAREEAAGGRSVPGESGLTSRETPDEQAPASRGAGDPAADQGPEDLAAGEPAPEAGASAQEVSEYRAAHAAWRSGDLDACIDQFRRFLQTHPASAYADDAAYWMAECHFKQGDYKSAILRFDDVVTRYPEGDKSGDALYRQGEALLKLGPGYAKAASKAFERVVEEYPDSPRAGEAKRQLDLLGSG